MTNFGASFKKARESKGISLDKIATETRISTRFLAAIENEEFHLLPGGIFNRGFVRAYAEHVGLDPDQAVLDYERAAEVRAPAETVAASAANPAPTKIERHLYPIAIGALALLIIIFYVVTRDSGTPAEPIATPPAPVVQPATLPPSSTPPATAAAAPEPPPAPEPQKQASLSVELEAKETTWIKITTDGTSVVSGEILEPGMTRKFTAEKSIDVTIGNAAGLNLRINDMQVKSLGKPGQVREFTITPNNLKDFIS